MYKRFSGKKCTSKERRGSSFRDVSASLKVSVYRVIQNFASPSRAKNMQASAQLTISPSNTFNLNWKNQILDSETFCNCCKFNFPKMRFCMEMIGISSISSYLPENWICNSCRRFQNPIFGFPILN